MCAFVRLYGGFHDHLENVVDQKSDLNACLEKTFSILVDPVVQKAPFL